MSSEVLVCKKKLAITIGLSLSYIAMLLSLALFVFPTADDYSYGMALRDKGFWEYYVDFYMTWSGRFVSNAILPILGEKSNQLLFYRGLPVFLIGTFVASLYFFLSQLLKGSPLVLVAVTTLFTCSYFSGYGSLAQGVYWMAGGFTYQLAFNALLLFLGCYLYLIRNKNPSVLVILMLHLSVVVGTGSSELVLLTFCVASAATAFFALIEGHQHRKIFIYFFVVTLVLSLVAVFAPGNFARSANFEGTSTLLSRFLKALRIAPGGAFEIFKWIGRSPFLICMIALFPYLQVAVSGLIVSKWSQKANCLLAFGIGLFVFFLDYFLPVFSTGDFSGSRMESVAYTDVHIFSFIMFTTYLAPLLGQSRFGQLFLRKNTIITALFFTVVLLMPNTLNAITNFYNGTFVAYADAELAQYEVAKAGEGKNITLTINPHRPDPIFFRHNYDVKRTWIQGVFCSFWKLNSVSFLPPVAAGQVVNSDSFERGKNE